MPAEMVKPHEEAWWHDHLDWMLLNYPERTQELFQTKKLKEYLDKKVISALVKSVELAKRMGIKPEESWPQEKADRIEEAIRVSLIAPPDGPEMSDNPPEPLPPSMIKRIMRWSERDFPPVPITE